MAESPEKKQKTEEEVKDVEVTDAAKEEPPKPPKPPEPPKELEEDAKKDTSTKIKDKVTFLTSDTTMNVLPSSVGNMLVALCDGGGLQYLLAGARANVGVKSGRYMFEAKIVEQMNPAEDGGKKSNSIGRNVVRLGFTAAGGSLFLGEDEDSIGFDNDGFMVTNKRKDRCAQTFGRDTMLSVVLNLDSTSPNVNTVSLFRDGVRASEPQALPEAMKGKTLFPCVAFKNSTVHVNFGQPCVPLPFKCKVLQESVDKEVAITKHEEPKDGKYKVIFPVSLPDEGTFDWLDNFLSKNQDYTEISDRAINDWAEKSGLFKVKAKKMCNDKPEVSFGAPSLDDISSIKRLLYQVASITPRNFVIMEVQSNLIKDQRSAIVAKFKTPLFKAVAEVMIGEPAAELVKLAQKRNLELKQQASDMTFRAKKVEDRRQWSFRKMKKEAERKKKKQDKDRLRAAEELKRKHAADLKQKAKDLKKAAKAQKKAAEEAVAKKAADEADAVKKAAEAAERLAAAKKLAEAPQGETPEGEKKEDAEGEKKEDAEGEKKKEEGEEEKKNEEKKDEAMEEQKESADEKKEEAKAVEASEESEEEKEEEMAPEPESEQSEDEAEPKDEDPPKAELSDQEKKLKFFPHPIQDLTQYIMSTSFTKFSVPGADEGFDEVKYTWAKEKVAAGALKEWILNRKITTRVEDIKPSEWFNQKHSVWQKVLQSWISKQSEFKNKVAKRAHEKAIMEAQKLAKREQAARLATWEANKKAAEEKKAALEKEAAEKAAEEEAAMKALAAEEKKDGEEPKEETTGEKTEEKKEEKVEEKVEEKEEEKQEDKKEEKKAEEAAPEDKETGGLAPPPLEVEEEKEEKETEEDAEAKVDFVGVDIFGVQDVCDIGAGVPLFRDFQFEDVALLALRFELNLLVHGFRRDVCDPERTGIHLDHLAFYYQRYFKKTLTCGQFGVKNCEELVNLVNDTVYTTKNGVLVSWLPDELESQAVFVKLTEEARRHRNVQIDLGVEGARLKIQRVDAGYDQSKGKKRGWEGNDGGQPHKGGNWGDKGAWGPASHGKDVQVGWQGGKGCKDWMGGKTGGGKDFKGAEVTCNDFQRGVCTRGDMCKFSHGAAGGKGKGGKTVLPPTQGWGPARW